MIKQKQTQNGFTIIEVVLVLAIAGLIFLIVFMALPALQRSRRDTQRKNDVGRVVSSLETYASNNNGRYPAGSASAWNTFISGYVSVGGSEFADPETGSYTYRTTVPNGANMQPGQIWYNTGYVCNGQIPTTSGAGSRNFAVVIYQENGNSFCQDNK